MNYKQLNQTEKDQTQNPGNNSLKLSNRVSSGLNPQANRSKRQSVIGGLGSKAQDFLSSAMKSSFMQSGVKDASIVEDELEDDLNLDYGAEALDDLKQLN